MSENTKELEKLDLQLKNQAKEILRSRKQVTTLRGAEIVDPPRDTSTANMIVDLTGQLVIKKPKFKRAINSMRKSSDAANTLLMLRSSQGEAVTPALVEAALQSLKIQFPFMASVADFLLALVAGHVSSVNYASIPATALLTDTARVHMSSLHLHVILLELRSVLERRESFSPREIAQGLADLTGAVVAVDSCHGVQIVMTLQKILKHVYRMRKAETTNLDLSLERQFHFVQLIVQFMQDNDLPINEVRSAYYFSNSVRALPNFHLIDMPAVHAKYLEGLASYTESKNSIRAGNAFPVRQPQVPPCSAATAGTLVVTRPYFFNQSEADTWSSAVTLGLPFIPSSSSSSSSSSPSSSSSSSAASSAAGGKRKATSSADGATGKRAKPNQAPPAKPTQTESESSIDYAVRMMDKMEQSNRLAVRPASASLTEQFSHPTNFMESSRQMSNNFNANAKQMFKDFASQPFGSFGSYLGC
jgi:hypothetical protein